MSSPRQVAAGFTITGLLDGASRTRGRYPVSEIAVADIADHPANAAYSMDPAGIAELAESIREDGLTDLPLVRKVGDGSWQMVSGHRRKAAYALLAKDDPAYERLARRIAEDLSPEWAAEADRGNLSAEAVRSLAGMPKERQAEMRAAMEPWRRTKRELSDYVRSEGKAQAGPDGRIAKAARLVADFLESPPESPSAADLSLLREMALMTAPYAEAGAGAHKGRRRASGPKSSK